MKWLAVVLLQLAGLVVHHQHAVEVTAVAAKDSMIEFPVAQWIVTCIMKAHASIDQRSLALGQAVARRLRDDPALVTRARATLRRWVNTCSPRVRPALLEWDRVLQSPVAEVLEVLTGTSERAIRLRQSNPFAGVLSPRERSAILKEFAAYDAASA